MQLPLIGILITLSAAALNIKQLFNLMKYWLLPKLLLWRLFFRGIYNQYRTPRAAQHKSHPLIVRRCYRNLGGNVRENEQNLYMSQDFGAGALLQHSGNKNLGLRSRTKKKQITRIRLNNLNPSSLRNIASIPCHKFSLLSLSPAALTVEVLFRTSWSGVASREGSRRSCRGWGFIDSMIKV